MAFVSQGSNLFNQAIHLKPSRNTFLLRRIPDVTIRKFMTFPKSVICSTAISFDFPIFKVLSKNALFFSSKVSQDIQSMALPSFSVESVLKSSLSSSLKLFAVCAFVVWLQKRGSIPENSSAVLSQVSFYIFIPCFLLSKVASSLVEQELKNLIFLPFVAIIHVISGAILGNIACKLAYSEPSSKPRYRTKSGSQYHASASLIASSVAEAAGFPLTSSQTYPSLPPSKSNLYSPAEKENASLPYLPPPLILPFQFCFVYLHRIWKRTFMSSGSRIVEGMVAPDGTGLISPMDEMKRRVLISSCAFGNSMTLPLIFVSNVLSQSMSSSQLEAAVSYIALYMVGWSPTLWTVGLNYITGRVSSTPIQNELENSQTSSNFNSFFAYATAQISRAAKIINPPLIGIIIGIVIGATPLKTLFFSMATQQEAIITQVSPTFLLSNMFSALFKPLMEAVTLIGSSTLSVQTIVLASSLSAIPFPSISLKTIRAFGKEDERENIFEQNFFSNDNIISNQSLSSFSDPKKLSNSNSKSDKVNGTQNQNVDFEIDQKNALLLESTSASERNEKEDRISSVFLGDSRSLVVISIVRLLLMPIVGIFIAMALKNLKLIPADPICSLVIMIQSAMPSAQNLVLLCQLHSNTQPISSMLASLLLKQYAISMIPITFWLPLFLFIAN